MNFDFNDERGVTNMSTWVDHELQTADFGDQRLTKRFSKMVAAFFDHPEQSIPQACGAWKDTKAAYNFFSSDSVDPSTILAPHIARTAARAAAYDRILCLQDTTEFDFTHHPSTTGLGYLEKRHMRGFYLHNALGVTTDGVPLGLLYQHYWTRSLEDFGKSKDRMRQPIEQKESYRWIEAMHQTSRLIPSLTEVVTVCDREADMYDLFEAERPDHHHLLIRAVQNRRITAECHYLFKAIDIAPVLGYHSIRVERGHNQQARDARLEIRVTSVELKPPQCKAGKNNRPTIPVQIVVAQEVDPPEGIEPIRWVLTTTLPVESFEDALLIIEYYSRRWLVERFHFTLKSGCTIEQLQLKTADELQNATATYSIVAWRLMWAMYLSRQEPDIPATNVLTQDELEALYATTHRKKLPSSDVVTIQQAILWIAKLGGFLARKRDGNPGLKTLWRGWMRLTEITQTWIIAKTIEPPIIFMGKD